MIHGESQCQDWAGHYSAAPSYRFILSSGIAGNTPWVGLMRASEDKVGRRFPFCVAMSLSETALPCHNVALQSHWFDAADSLLDRVLSSDYVFDNLQAELADLAQLAPATDSSTVDPVTINDRRSSDTLTISMMALAGLDYTHTLAPLLDTVLRQTLGEYSLWLSRDSAQTTILNSGLPADEAGLALFTADWASASTAQIDLASLPSSGPLGNSFPDAGFDPKGNMPPETQDTDAASINPEDELSGLIESSEDTVAYRDTAEFSTSKDNPDAESANAQEPSADDWAALDDFDDNAKPYVEVIVPQVEPLELDEDDLPEAPWEK
jgi:type VI secretion system protein ImpM